MRRKQKNLKSQPQKSSSLFLRLSFQNVEPDIYMYTFDSRQRQHALWIEREHRALLEIAARKERENNERKRREEEEVSFSPYCEIKDTENSKKKKKIGGEVIAFAK